MSLWFINRMLPIEHIRDGSPEVVIFVDTVKFFLWIWTILKTIIKFSCISITFDKNLKNNSILCVLMYVLFIIITGRIVLSFTRWNIWCPSLGAVVHHQLHGHLQSHGFFCFAMFNMFFFAITRVKFYFSPKLLHINCANRSL